MKKRLLTLFLAVCLCMITLLPAFAVNETPEIADTEELVSILESNDLLVTRGSDVTTTQTKKYARVNDGGDLLSASEEEKLEAALDEISNRQQFDVVVVTTDSTGGKTPMEYADDFYDYNGYGYGEERDGALLLISMEERDWYISTCGYGITALTDYGIQQIGDSIIPYLKDQEYYDCFSKFARLCDSYVTTARTSAPIDIQGYSGIGDVPRIEHKAPFNFGSNILISLIIGFVVALIITGAMRSKLKTVRFQAAANDYVNPGSLKIARSQDLFLYSTVTRTAIPKETRSGGGGGGSSTHVSSSGSTHGGGGGKF